MADLKITQLTEDSVLALTDLIATVEDPTGTPVTKKATLQTLHTAISKYSLYRQALINGNFDIWQRATTSTNPADAAFVADRWHVSRDADSGTLPSNTIHSRQLLTSGDVPGSYYYYRINPDGAGSSFGSNAQYVLRQKIENGTRLLAGTGNKVTISFYARSSLASKKLGIGMFQNYGTTGSPTSAETLTGTTVTLTSSWVKYSYTFTLNTLVGKTFGTDENDYLLPILGVMWGSTYGSATFGGASAEDFVGSGTIDITQVQLCLGALALDFEPRPVQEELRLCQRYLWKHSFNSTGSSRLGFGSAVSTTVVDIVLQPPVRLRATPTLTTSTVSSNNFTVSDGGTGTNVTALALRSWSTKEMLDLQCTVASGLTQFRPYWLEAGTSNDHYLLFDAEL